MARVLVTGGAGFIGSHIVQAAMVGVRVGDVRHVFADAGRAQRELGFRATEDFRNAVAELAEQMRVAA